MDATLHSILFGKYRNELIQADLPAAEAPFYRIADIGHIAKATEARGWKTRPRVCPMCWPASGPATASGNRAPEAVPGSKRRITVELSDTARMKHPGAEVRAREGYYAH